MTAAEAHPAPRRPPTSMHGRDNWTSLADLARSPEFRDRIEREFPRHAALWDSGLDRRRFLELAAASLALGGLSACVQQPPEPIVPYVNQPELVTPGIPLYFATTLLRDGLGIGAIAESHEGRPTKIEGNPNHPASLGAADAIMQAEILTLYDPDRAATVLREGRIAAWADFTAWLHGEAAAWRPSAGRGLRLLTGPISSPSLLALIARWLERFPAARWHVHSPLRPAAALEPFAPLYHVERAERIVALDCDFLLNGPASLAHARRFIDGRRVRADRPRMNRLYALESRPTLTGANADQHWTLPPPALELAVARLAALVGVPGAAPALDWPAGADWLPIVARDLLDHPARSLIVADERLSPEARALCNAINQRLGAAGATLDWIPNPAPPPEDGSLVALAEAMRAGEVDTLFIFDCNPVHTAPADFNFADLLRRVRRRVCLGLYHDETAALCHWHIPRAHELESWGDARAFDGTISTIQPLIAPLYGGRTPLELLALMTGENGMSDYDRVRAHWTAAAPGADFDARWRRWLHDGVFEGTALPAAAGPAPADPAAALAALERRRADAAPARLHLLFEPDPALLDGRYANNGWLMELPRPITKLTWDNAALIAPATARRLGLASRQVVELTLRGRSLRVPVWIVPGHAADCVTLPFGFGRERAGRVGDGVGVDAYRLRFADTPWWAAGLELTPTDDRYPLACTQDHFRMHERAPVREATLAEFIQTRGEIAPGHGDPPAQEPSLLPEFPYDGCKWGMAIDLTACIGCNACVAACQAENNIPVVGREQVALGREMHWLRIDRYYTGDLHQPDTAFQPLACVHCEHAPCEVVCPVAATVHDAEGLNLMVYNRCIGTRYCSNNCPYKVRRFNFLQYTDRVTESLKLMRNPEVTVRNRGVMEKCTYCIQRISRARHAALREGRAIGADDVHTACQAACPTRAITFGDLNHPGAEVNQWKAEPHNYDLLGDLNTRPRTSYLARIRNPHDELDADRSQSG